MITRNITIPALLLGMFALLGTGMVALTFEATRERIAQNERDRLLRSINTLIPAESYDNDLFDDTVDVLNTYYLGSADPVTIYRARKGGEPVAAVLPVIAREGYTGPIGLLVAIHAHGELAGVRVVTHRETPGLGDGIDEERSDWIHQFAGRSLADPGKEGWKVRRDGGEFDQLTGATITPRAVVKAVYRALVYFRDYHDQVFAEP